MYKLTSNPHEITILSFQECRPDTHPGADELRRKRVRLYTHLRGIDHDCRGAISYTRENYLIIDNATGSDAGDYSFTVTIHDTVSITMQRNFSIVIGTFGILILVKKTKTITLARKQN